MITHTINYSLSKEQTNDMNMKTDDNGVTDIDLATGLVLEGDNVMEVPTKKIKGKQIVNGDEVKMHGKGKGTDISIMSVLPQIYSLQKILI